MGLLSSLKRSLNIGGCELTLAPALETQPQGVPVTGTVSVRGGELEQHATALEIALEEFWTEQRGKHRTTVHRLRASQILEEDLAIRPGMEQAWGFSLPLPHNCRLSTGATGWRLKVTLDIPRAVDPTSTLKLEVVAAPEFQAVAEACSRELGFTLKPGSWRWDKDGHTSCRLLPPPELEGELDHLDLRLALPGPERHLAGQATFNLQEKSLKDYGKALLGMDRVAKPLAIPRDRLRRPDGSPDFAAIADAIRPMIEELVRLRARPDDLAARPGGDPVRPDPDRAKAKRIKEFDPKSLDT